MGKRSKIVIISLVVLLVLGIVGLVIGKQIAQSKIEDFLANSLPENIQVDYDNLDLSLLSGSLQITKPTLTVLGKTTDSIILRNEMKSINVNNISYWNYLFSDKISIASIEISDPKIIFHYNKLASSEKLQKSKNKKQKNKIEIEHIIVKKGAVSIVEYGTTSEMFRLKNLNFDISDILFDEKTSKSKIPFGFTDYHMDFKDFFYEMNAYDNLEIESLNLSNKEINLESLRLFTKFSREKLSQMITKERDHVDLKIDKITVNDHKFGYDENSKFYFSSPKVDMMAPNLDIYRDKLVADDTTIKDLYSKMLRNLTFDLTLNELEIQDGTLVYSEKVKEGNAAGEIDFKNMTVAIKNLSNTYDSSEKTQLDIDATFMKTTPINVLWDFDVNNVNDHFSFKVEIGKLPAQDLNPFIKPNANVEFEGELLKTYFTVDGNNQDASVNLRTNYDDFKVLILDKEGKRKNKVLSAVANLFVKKDSNKSNDNFREGSKTNIERDKTKSVFNFLWLNARGGLLSALTGDGKK